MARALLFLPVGALLALASCDSPKKSDASGVAAIASASLAIKALTPAPSQAVPQGPEKPVVRRPKDPGDVVVTPERRARVESLVPEAKGFLTTEELESALYKMQLARGKDPAAVKALDKIAAGKWVLFTGNIGSLTEATFELPVRYTPRDPNDVMGITAVWIPVQFSNVKGYSEKEYRPGEFAVVLAKYEGAKKATSGHDVVFLQKWFE
jgi:hypothetical protein